jgi:hypothetical protein
VREWRTGLDGVGDLLDLDAVAEHEVGLGRALGEDDTGAIQQLDVLVDVHLLHGARVAGGGAHAHGALSLQAVDQTALADVRVAYYK